MAKIEKTEVVVIGAGPAGYVCAIRLAQLGKKVTVVERENLGGVCLNVGCIPSKALIHAGHVVDQIKHAADMGITVKDVKIDFKKIMAWKETVVKKLTGGVGALLKANGCQVVSGQATFLRSNAIEVKSSSGTTEIQFDSLVIATGSRPMPLKGFDIDQKSIVDSTGALALTDVPETLLCIGGGYIGLELGTFYANMGTKVTVAEAAGGLLAGVDPELARVVDKKLRAKGVEVLTKAEVRGQKKSGSGIEVEMAVEGATKKKVFEKVLVTIGRKPNTENLGLEKAGVQLDAKGFIVVDNQRRTSAKNIFAIGDCAGQPLLAHKGSKEGIVAAEVIGGKKTVYDVIAIPAVIFTEPEIATVGLTDTEAKAKGFTPKIGMFPFGANGRALSVGEPDGFVKMVSDQKTGRLLGVHIVGTDASNLIAEAALALEMGANVEDLALTVHAHPTLPETIMEAAEATMGHAIHIFQKPVAKTAPTLVQ